MMCSVTNRFYAKAILHDDVINQVSCSFAMDGFHMGKTRVKKPSRVSSTFLLFP